MSQYADDTNLSKRIAIYGYSTSSLSWSQWYSRYIPLTPGARILDIGCGNASLWADLAESLDESVTVVLADSSGGMIRAARERLDRVSGNWKFRIASIERLPFDSRSFDVVIANHMLYHAADIVAAVREAARVLEPHGVALASTNGKAHMRQLGQWTIECGLPQAAEKLRRNAEIFGLENGATMLSSAFGHVETHRYENSLVIADATPVTGYVASLELPNPRRSRSVATHRGDSRRLSASTIRGSWRPTPACRAQSVVPTRSDGVKGSAILGGVMGDAATGRCHQLRRSAEAGRNRSILIGTTTGIRSRRASPMRGFVSTGEVRSTHAVFERHGIH